MGWGLTRAAGTSFFAALFYSLAAPTQWLVPDGDFRWARIWEARRLFLVSVWDDAPHLAALALLPPAILFLALAIERRRGVYAAAAAFCIALMATASVFGPVMVGMAAIALLAASPAAERPGRALRIAGIGVYAYLMAIAFLPPSVLGAIREAAAVSDEEKWTIGSLTAIAAAILGWTILQYLLQRFAAGARFRFFVYFSLVAGSAPLAAAYLHRRMLPQPGRYKFEFELGLALLAAFGGQAILRRFPVGIRRAVVLLLLTVAAEQVVDYRKLEKSYLFPRDVTQTVEYRASVWTAAHLPGVRVFFPGSMAQWANAFAEIPQFSGSSWSMATNQSQQNANAAIVFEARPIDEGARLSQIWLKAYGVGAIAVAGAQSTEYWKPFSDPGKFDGLPALWSESGVTIRQVAARSASLAHVVPVAAIPRHAPKNPEDAGEAARYVAALEDPSMPPAALQWEGRERMRIRASFSPGQALSVQEGYSPGWRASVGGQARPVLEDGLGLMWLRPECQGGCEIVMQYGGGWELWICRIISYAALGGLLFWVIRRGRQAWNRAA
jgi:hypothetical protein